MLNVDTEEIISLQELNERARDPKFDRRRWVKVAGDPEAMATLAKKAKRKRQKLARRRNR